jgi:hypothetical protein
MGPTAGVCGDPDTAKAKASPLTNATSPGFKSLMGRSGCASAMPIWLDSSPNIGQITI